jgi:uncharacterized membrane protein
VNGKDDKAAKSASSLMKIEASFSGPLPPPSLLAKYSEIIPNGAERIMAMVEKQSEHREKLESRVVNGNVASQTRGSWFAFILCLVALVGGFYLILQGKSVAGLVSIIGSVGVIGGVFVVSRREQKNERVEKFTALQKRRQR